MQWEIYLKVSAGIMKLLLVMINDHFSAFQDMKDFGAFWGMRKIKHEAHKLSFWKYLTINKTCPYQFPETQSASFLLSTLNSFRRCWRSAAAAAYYLILVEIDGKHPCVCMLSRFSCVQLFAIPWTVACQAPLSMGFSRQEYRSR